MEFEFQTGKFILDYSKCHGCTTYACVKACSLYGNDILRIRHGRVALIISPQEAGRRCIECLSCEVECMLQGRGAIKVYLPIVGLDEHVRDKHGDIN